MRWGAGRVGLVSAAGVACVVIIVAWRSQAAERAASMPSRDSVRSAPTSPGQLALPRELDPEREVGDANPAPLTTNAVEPEVERALHERVYPQHVIRGRVVDLDGAPVEGAVVRFAQYLVSATGAAPRRRFAPGIARSDAQGHFSISVPETGGRIEAKGSQLATVRAPTVDSPPDTERDHRVVVTGVGLVTGSVVDDAGAPVPGARVQLLLPMERFDEASPFDRQLGWDHRAQTESDGSFAIPDCPRLAGSRLLATAQGFEQQEVELGAVGDEHVTLQLSRIRSESLVCGHVLDASGAPAAKALVSLGGLLVETDVQGSFCIDLNSPGMTEVGGDGVVDLLAIQGEFQSARISLPAPSAGLRRAWADPTILRLDAPRLTIQGVVADDAGRPVPGVLVRLADPSPFGVREISPGSGAYLGVAVESIGASRWDNVRTDLRGWFRLGGLEARNYSLEIEDPRTLAIQVDGPWPAGTQDAVIRFDPDYRWLEGRTVSNAGRPLPGVELAVTVGDGTRGIRVGQSVYSDTEGRFRLGPVGGDRVTLQIRGDGVLPVDRWEVPASNQELRIPLSLPCPVRVDWGSIEGRSAVVRFADANGEPLEPVWVAAGGTMVVESIRAQSADTFLVSETAALALAMDGDVELARTSLNLDPSKLELIRF